jgi:anionic cell wall polymer biosynthesis LytR-Cps2A-Psr (LCP) family protein
MSTVVGVMDRDGWASRTDNIVVVDGRRRLLTWVPRDLWSPVVGHRINHAYERGGHPLLSRALAELGYPVESSVVLWRSAVERAVSDLRIVVPVDRSRRYWYPLAPTLKIEDGAKWVVFDAPEETLEGERIHQWIGARTSADSRPPQLPDLERIGRQQILVRRLLETRFDFSTLLRDPELVTISGATAVSELSGVRADWSLRTYDRVAPATIDGKAVLVPCPLRRLLGLLGLRR